MVFVPVPNVAQCNLRFTLDTEQVENTLYFRHREGAMQEVDMGELGNNLIVWYTSEIATGVTSKLELREVYVVDLTTQDGPALSVVPGLPVQGGDTDPMLPNNVTLAVSFRTAARGRSGRGRNYVCGLTEQMVVDNEVTASVRDFFQSGYADLLTRPAIDTAWEWVVVSRYFNGERRPIGLERPVTSVVITDRTVDSQRRRLPGRGR